MVGLLPVLGAALVGNFQVFNSYLLWAETNYELMVFGWAMPVTWLLSFGSVIVLASIAGSVLFWRWWAQHRTEPSAFTKMTVGAFIMSCAPLVPAICSSLVATTGHKASLMWALAYEVINDVGYANLLPVGLALYSRAAPKSIGGTVTSLYYVLLFFTNMMVGWLGGFLERLSGTQFWLLHVAVVFSAALVMLALRGTVARSLTPADEAPFPEASRTLDAQSAS
jgi:POT family proton-dependent oligopeptide transporter